MKFLGVPKGDGSKRERLDELLDRGQRLWSRAGAKPTAAGGERRRGAPPSLPAPRNTADATITAVGPSTSGPASPVKAPVERSVEPPRIVPSEHPESIHEPDVEAATKGSVPVIEPWTGTRGFRAGRGIFELPVELAASILNSLPFRDLSTARLVNGEHRGLVDQRHTGAFDDARNALFQFVVAIRTAGGFPRTGPQLRQSLLDALPCLLPDDLQYVIDSLITADPRALEDSNAVRMLVSIARSLGVHATPFIRRIANAIDGAPARSDAGQATALRRMADTTERDSQFVRLATIAADRRNADRLDRAPAPVNPSDRDKRRTQAANETRARLIAGFITRYRSDSPTDRDSSEMMVLLEPLTKMAADPTKVDFKTLSGHHLPVALRLTPIEPISLARAHVACEAGSRQLESGHSPLHIKIGLAMLLMAVRLPIYAEGGPEGEMFDTDPASNSRFRTIIIDTVAIGMDALSEANRDSFIAQVQGDEMASVRNALTEGEADLWNKSFGSARADAALDTQSSE